MPNTCLREIKRGSEKFVIKYKFKEHKAEVKKDIKQH